MSKPTKTSAAITSAGLSLVFIIVYGGCNWITAHRQDVGTWYYQWERFIPFVPLMIVPYMSIDLFFVAGPFLCGNRDELRVFSRRIIFAIVVAGAFFLSMPLTLAVHRPQSTGWTGAVFSFLHGFDQPYNLFPSLHITLRTILADLYARHSRGPACWASHVWFSLIGLSTLLTYQHHVVDVIGGFVLAAFCFYLFRESRERLFVSPNFRVGGYYVFGAAILFVAALAAWPWTAILLWPALALAITASAYFGLGPVIYGKTGGRLPFSTRLVLAPCLVGQHISLRHYRRRCDRWNEVAKNVWIGRWLNHREAAELKQRGVTAVLDLTCEFPAPAPFQELAYCNLPVLDLTRLTPAQLNAAVDFISKHAASGIVYVHCKVGYSRSGAAVGAWLLASGRAASAEEAADILRRARPGIILRPEVADALRLFRSTIADCGSRIAD